MDHSTQLTKVLNYENWVGNLAYLSDMLRKMNESNLSLQGETVTDFKAVTKCLFLREN